MIDLRPSGRALFCLLAPSLSSGCGVFGGQTGEGDPAPPSCRAEPAIPLGLAEQTTHGYSAHDILAFSAAFKQSGVWPASEAEREGAAPKQAHIEFNLQPRSEQARWIRHVMTRGEKADELCVDTLEIDVHYQVKVESELGGWQQEGDGVLLSKGAELAVLTEYLPLEGDPTPFHVDVQDTNEKLSALKLDLLFSPWGQAGALELVTQKPAIANNELQLPPTKPQGSNGDPPTPPDDLEFPVYYPLAYYPAESPCGGWTDDWGAWQHRSAIAVDLSDPASPISATQWEETFTYEASLAWKNGDHSQLTSSAQFEGTTACLEPACWYCGWLAFDSFPLMTGALQLSLRTADSDLDGQYAARSQVELGEAQGALHAVSTSCSISRLKQDELKQRSGLSGELSEDGQAFFECELAQDLQSARPTGIVALRPYLPGSIQGEHTWGEW